MPEIPVMKEESPAAVSPSSNFVEIGKNPTYPPWRNALGSQPLSTAAEILAATSSAASPLIQRRVRLGL